VQPACAPFAVDRANLALWPEEFACNQFHPHGSAQRSDAVAGNRTLRAEFAIAHDRVSAKMNSRHHFAWAPGLAILPQIMQETPSECNAT
jgi:hypothetical protein